MFEGKKKQQEKEIERCLIQSRGPSITPVIWGTQPLANLLKAKVGGMKSNVEGKGAGKKNQEKREGRRKMTQKRAKNSTFMTLYILRSAFIGIISHQSLHAYEMENFHFTVRETKFQRR